MPRPIFDLEKNSKLLLVLIALVFAYYGAVAFGLFHAFGPP
jgi:hypothetical protein